LGERGVAEPAEVERGEHGKRGAGDREPAADAGRERERGTRDRAERDCRGGLHSKSPPVSTSPRNWTSGSSATPKRSRTHLRPSAISAITSAVGASPRFSPKFPGFPR